MNLPAVITGPDYLPPSLSNDVNLLREWIESIPFFPKTVGNEVLAGFQAYWCDSEDQLKEMIMKYFIYRQNNWNVFRSRHSKSYAFKRFSAVSVLVSIPKEDTSAIFIYSWLRNSDWKKFSVYQQAKLILAQLDIVLQETGFENKTVTIVQDMASFSRDHLASITAYSAQVVNELFHSMPISLRLVLIVNPPDFVSEYTQLFAPLDFHIVEYVNELASFIDPSYLPSDLGGKPGSSSREEMRLNFMNELGRYAPVLAYDEQLRDDDQYVRYTLPDPPPVGGAKRKKKGGKGGKKKK